MAKNNKKEKKQKEDNIIKTINIGKHKINFTKSDMITVPILLIIMICYFLSPNVYRVTTARYGQGSEEDNKNVVTALGEEDTEEKFEIYFQWYNVLHELGHGVLIYNSNIDLTAAEEEQLVNDFAVAYWLAYGEDTKVKELRKIAEYASENINTDIPKESNYIKYADENWNKFSFKTFNNYGWFQFNSVKESFENRKSLGMVLKEMGIENYKLPAPKVLTYPEITEDVSSKIINDAIRNFREWGLEFPDAAHFFSNNPNTNNSAPAKNIFGLLTLLDK